MATAAVAVGPGESLELAIKRGIERTAFKKQLINLGGNRERIAECRLAIDQARLLTLQAAWKIDTLGVKTTEFDLSDQKKKELEESGKAGALKYFDWFEKNPSLNK